MKKVKYIIFVSLILILALLSTNAMADIPTPPQSAEEPIPSRLADDLAEYINADVLSSFVEYVDEDLVLSEDEVNRMIWIAPSDDLDDGWPVAAGTSGYRLESLLEVLSRDDFFGRRVYAPEGVYNFLEGMGIAVKDVLVPVNQEQLIVLTSEGVHYVDANWCDWFGEAKLFVQDEDLYDLIYRITVGE